MKYDDQLAYEDTIHYLKLENKQLGRELRGAKAELVENDAIIKKQNQTLLHIDAEIEFIKQHPFDLVLIDGSIENISKVIKGQIESIIDDECVGCCKVVDVAAKLQEELDASRSLVASYNKGNDRVKERLKAEKGEVARLRFIVAREHGEAAKLQKELDAKTEIINNFKIIETRETDRLHKIIEELKDGNAEDLKELYDLDMKDIKGLEAELSARKEDSAVLMKVVEIIRDNGIYPYGAMNELVDLLVDYLDVPEGPPEITIDESDVLKKIRALVDDWSVNKKGGKQSFFILSEIDDMLKSTQHIDENQDITVTFAWLELP